MKKRIGLLIAILLMIATAQAFAAGEIKSGAFTYRIKGNGTAAITGYDWSSSDIYIPRMLDGYTVTEIDAEAFATIELDENGVIEVPFTSNRHKVSTLVIPDTVVYIGERAFLNDWFEVYSVFIPASVEYIGAGAFSNLYGVSEFVVDGANQHYATIDGILYDKVQKKLIACPPGYGASKGKVLGDSCWIVRIPEGIRSIDDYAFFGWDRSYNSSISYGSNFHFDFPSTLEEIGDYAFAYVEEFEMQEECEMRGYKDRKIVCSVWHFPDALSKIGEGAFYKATKEGGSVLIEYLLLNNTQIKDIPALAFYQCDIEEIQLPETLISIGESAFADGYGKIVFPSSLQSIGKKAFYRHGGIVIKDKLKNAWVLDLSTCVQLESIDDFAFSVTGIEQAILPDGLRSIGTSAFQNDWLKELTIPSSVTSIGDSICNKNKVKLNVQPGSYAATWASENGYITQSAGDEDTSWLN